MKKVIKLISCIGWLGIVYLFFGMAILILSLLKALNIKEIYLIKSTRIFKNKHRKKYGFIEISPC
jgi:hypothetical protein